MGFIWSSDTLDRFVEKGLKITEDEWVVAKEQKELELVLSVKEVSYKELSFVDHVALELVNGEGWSIDLNDNGVEETYERYLGTLGSFVRINKHTISFEDYHSDWGGFAVASYSLNDNHDLCRKEQLSEVRKEK